MVFAREVAVVVKARDGRTLLLQSRGMDFQQASLAAGEAMATLQASAQQPEPWDILSNSQAAPLLCGRVQAVQGKLAVTYRVAGGLVFLLVTHPTANVFSCVQLLNSVVRVVAAPVDGKAGGITPEQLYRKFGEAYLAVDALIVSGGVLEANAAIGRALTAMDQLVDKDKDKDKGRGGPEQPKTPPQLQPQQQQRAGGRIARRTIQGVIDQLAMLSFSTGSAMQDARPRPGFQIPEPVVPQESQAAFGAVDLRDDPFFDGLGAKKAAPKQDPKDPFAPAELLIPEVPKKEPVAPADKKGEDAEKKAVAVGFEDDAFGDAAAFGIAAAPPALPVPSEPVLRLAESWRGECAGGRIVRAGLAGRVEWVSEAAKAKVHTVQFMVQGPEASGEHLAAALSTCRRHPACCRPGPVAGVLVADGIQAKPHPGAPLLCYHLPPVALHPPMQAQLGASFQPTPDGRRLVTLGLHYAISPRVAPRAEDLTVEVTVPAVLELPLRASPADATFDAKTRTLRWEQRGPIVSLDNSGSGAQPFVASFIVGEAAADDAALAGALARLSARLSLRGVADSGTLSGAALAQGVAELEWTPSLCSWRAELTATP